MGREEIKVIHLNCASYTLNKITQDDLQRNTIKTFPASVILQDTYFEIKRCLLTCPRYVLMV